MDELGVACISGNTQYDGEVEVGTFDFRRADDVAVVIRTNLQGSMPERFIDRVAAYYILGFPE